MPRSGARILVFLIVAVVAGFLAWLGHDPLRHPGAGEPVFWPLAGFGAVALVYLSPKLWPSVVIGLVTGTLAVVVGIAQTPVNFAGLAAGLCESLLVALLLRRLRPRSALEERLMDTPRVLASVLAASMLASVVFAVAGGASGERAAISLWGEFVRNHLLALLLVSPCLVVYISRRELLGQLREFRRNLEWLLQLGATTVLSALLFLTNDHLFPSMLLVLPLIWGALRLGPLRSTASLLVGALIITVGTNRGMGRIAAFDSSREGLITLQSSVAVMALAVIFTTISARLREQTVALLAQRTADLNEAERLAGLGSSRWYPATGRATWSDGLHLVLGTDPEKDVPGTETYMRRVHPEDRERVAADIAALTQDDGRAQTTEYRIVRPDGEVRDVVLRMIAERNRAGGLQYVFFTVQDVTEARSAAARVSQAHAELTAVLNAVTGTAILGTEGKNGKISFFNVGAERLFGYRAEEVIGKITTLELHDQKVLGGSDPRRLTAAGIERNGTYSGQRIFARKDGSTFPGQLTVTAQDGADGKLIGFIGVVTDLTSVLRTQEELAESEKRFRLAFDTAPMGMAMVSLSSTQPGRFLRVNDALSEFAGMGPAELLRATVGDLLEDPEHYEQSQDNLLRLKSGELDTVTTVRRLNRPDGAERWGRVSASAVRPGGDREPYLILLIEDITARKELTDRLQHEAAHDSLTGLPNRLHLHRQLERELRERHSGYVAVLYLDLDGFKAVNDTQGHGAGDELLVQVADRIAASVRASDVVARLGGDEFAVLCPGIPDAETALQTARRVLAVLSKEFDLSETRARVGASIGVAVAVDGDTGPELLHAADQAMYEAKRAGKGAVRLSLR
ncbi:sensor domain-containing diguanylate cyclase [Kineosporia sp. NBRC 101677]|uniref:sensor domain-containing diguanylate cyclase n=1 Tax=Kineosporia sp. NBRC 101677 TaxID=3032197 RepID=UPI002556A992|nr:sensor domain-containing diguanylate cyclase [Kineosporia sp. NBRC 101677]